MKYTRLPDVSFIILFFRWTLSALCGLQSGLVPNSLCNITPTVDWGHNKGWGWHLGQSLYLSQSKRQKVSTTAMPKKACLRLQAFTVGFLFSGCFWKKQSLITIHTWKIISVQKEMTSPWHFSKNKTICTKCILKATFISFCPYFTCKWASSLNLNGNVIIWMFVQFNIFFSFWHPK